MKKLIGAAVGVGMLFAAVVPTFAASNRNTGPFSTNINANVTFKFLSVSNDNVAFVSNEVTSVANSGGNSSALNTNGGFVKSGDASSYTIIKNDLNKNYTHISM